MIVMVLFGYLWFGCWFWLGIVWFCVIWVTYLVGFGLFGVLLVVVITCLVCLIWCFRVVLMVLRWFAYLVKFG